MMYSSTKFYFTLILLSYIFTGNNTPQASIQSFFREWLNTAQIEGLLIFKRLIYINRHFFNIPTKPIFISTVINTLKSRGCCLFIPLHTFIINQENSRGVHG